LRLAAEVDAGGDAVLRDGHGAVEQSVAPGELDSRSNGADELDGVGLHRVPQLRRLRVHVPHADLLVLTHRHLPADGWQFAGHSRGTGPGADVRLSVVRPVDGRLHEAPAPLVEAVYEVVDGVVREPPVQA